MIPVEQITEADRVATVLEIGQLEAALNQAKKESAGSGIKGRSRALHHILNEIASNSQFLQTRSRPGGH